MIEVRSGLIKNDWKRKWLSPPPISKLFKRLRESHSVLQDPSIFPSNFCCDFVTNNPTMASTSTGRPSSSSNFKSQWRYDVFLSFSGEATCRSFTDHLYSALIRNNIGTFRDDGLPRGGEIKPELLKAIEESRIAVIVFSKAYVHSEFCLEELVKIMNCRKEIVIPIFCYMNPSEVPNQTWIWHHERKADEGKMEKIRKWRTALREASNLAGYYVQNR